MCQIDSLFDWDTTLKATAFTYAGRMKTGRTRPMKFHCRTQDPVASTLDVVAKLSGTWEIGKPGFATEVFVSHLARIAGIYCPRPVILFIPEDLEVRGGENEVIQRSHGLNFASKFLPGATTWLNWENMSHAVIKQAVSVLLFDSLIQNKDRLATNPNLLFDGKHIIVIDHEQCLGVLGDPFQLDWIERHVLFPCVKAVNPPPGQIFEILDHLNHKAVDSAKRQIPKEGVTKDVEIMVKYLQDVLRQTDQLKSAFAARICQ